MFRRTNTLFWHLVIESFYLPSDLSVEVFFGFRIIDGPLLQSALVDRAFYKANYD